MLAWEQAQMDTAVVNAFGFHALQLGLPQLHALRANRIAHRWFASESVVKTESNVALVTDFAALPFPVNSLDLVVLPHTLEMAANPHGVLREVARVLVPEGRLVITGLNPVSLWGMRQRRAHLYRRFGVERMFLPDSGECIGYLRLRDWLGLLNLDIASEQFGCYRPAFLSQTLLQKFSWMDAAGERWWPILGSVYMFIAIKRVRGMTLHTPLWNPAVRLAIATASIAGNASQSRAGSQNDS